MKAILCALSLAVVFSLCHPVAAQQTLGSLNGTVTDSSGAVIPRAAVKVRNVETNFTVTAETKANGSFSVADLPIGTYEVTLSREGFQTHSIPISWCRPTAPPRSTPSCSRAPFRTL
jgi:hypothetical protein